MGKALMKRPLWQRITVLSVILTLIVTMCSTVFVAHADDDKEHMSFYKASSNISRLMSDAMSPGSYGEKIPEQWKVVVDKAGNAGSFLGYVDPDFSFSLDWLMSKATGSSASVSYKFLSESGGEGVLKGLLGYAQYGAALTDIGFVGTDGKFSGITRFIGGGLMLVVFSMASVVEGVFTLIISALDLLNPFRLFITAVNEADQANMISGEPPGALNGLTHFIASWYGILVGMSWAVIVPLLIGVLVFSLISNQKLKGNPHLRNSKVKNLIIRITYIVIGLPLLASLYTAALQSFTDSMSSSKAAGAQSIVLSNYLDVQAWAMPESKAGVSSTLGPLGIPEDSDGITAKWDAKTGTVSKANAGNGNLQSLARDINLSTGKYGKNAFGSSAVDENVDGSAIANSLHDKSETVDATAYQQMFDLLVRYMNGEKILASDYETYWKARVSESDSGETVEGEDNKALLGQFDALRKADRLSDVKSDKITYTNENTSLLLAENNGVSGEPLTVTSEGSKLTFTGNAGLSPISMYNFLNTEFRSNSLTVYSAEKVSSFKARDTMSSVTQVGSGFLGFLYWVNSLVILLAYSVVGLFYGLGMLLGSFKKGLSLMTAIPFATVGAIGAIAKVVIYTVAMFIEVLGTMFLYQIVSEFLFSINSIISQPLATAITSTGILGGLLTLIGLLISTLITFVFMLIALKIRKSALKGINESVTKFVNRFVETNINAPGSGSSVPGRMAKGALAGAGLAAANGKFLQGSGDGAPGTPGGMTGSGLNMEDSDEVTSPLVGGGGALALEAGPSGGEDGGTDGGYVNPSGPNGNGGPEGGSDGGTDGVNINAESSDGLSDVTSINDSSDNVSKDSDISGDSKVGGEDALSANSDDRELAEQIQDQNGLTQRGLVAGENVKNGAEAVVSGAKAVVKGKSGDLVGAASDAKDAVESARKIKPSSEPGVDGQDTKGKSKLSLNDIDGASKSSGVIGADGKPISGVRADSTGKNNNNGSPKLAKSANNAAANLLSTAKKNPIATNAVLGAAKGATKGTKAESAVNGMANAVEKQLSYSEPSKAQAPRRGVSGPRPRPGQPRPVSGQQPKPKLGQQKPTIKRDVEVVTPQKPHPSRTVRGGND